MAGRRTPDRAVGAYERFRLKKVERFSAQTEVALWHGRSRNARVAKVITYMGLIRAAGAGGLPLPVQPVVSCEGASQQFFRAGGENEAAHLLPGEIKIGGAECWLYLQGEPARLLKNEFGYVEPIHANFNGADWWAEQAGMTTAFADACRAVLTGTREPERDVADAYGQVWVPGALAAIAAAEAKLRARGLPPEPIYGEPGTAEFGMILNIEERGEAMNDSEIWNNFEQLSMLDYYRAAFDEDPPEIAPKAIRALLGG